MSVTRLAKLIDDLVDQSEITVTETQTHVIVQEASTERLNEIVNHIVEPLGNFEIRDSGDTIHQLGAIDENFAPFRISIKKPPAAQGVFRVLTNAAFKRLLESENTYSSVEVARLKTVVITLGCQFVPWGQAPQAFDRIELLDPNLVVRDLRRERRLPSTLSNWIWASPAPDTASCDSFSIWADAATRRLIPALADEVSPEGSVLFYGPGSRVAVDSSRLSTAQEGYLGFDEFCVLQSVSRWIYETPRQTAMRHALFSSEFARAATHQEDVILLFSNFGASTFDAAKIAYRLGLSELGDTALQLLSRLRTEVADQVDRSTSTTRQLILSLTGAVSLGIGLIAARLTNSAPSEVLLSIMVVATTYVGLVGFVGWRFVVSISENKSYWRRHLYRFLPQKHYKKMVLNPTNRVVFDYYLSLVLSGACMLIVWLSLLFAEFSGEIPGIDASGSAGDSPNAELGSSNETYTEGSGTLESSPQGADADRIPDASEGTELNSIDDSE